MDDIEKRARELLAAEYERSGLFQSAADLRSGRLNFELGWAREAEMAIRAIITALTPPEGFVLVPVEPTQEMLDAEHATARIHDEYGEDRYVGNAEEVWAAMLAARPEGRTDGAHDR